MAHLTGDTHAPLNSTNQAPSNSMISRKIKETPLLSRKSLQ